MGEKFAHPPVDITDVAVFCAEIRRQHEVELRWVLTPLVGKFNSAWQVRCEVWGPHLVGIARTYKRDYERVYPDRCCKSIETLMYQMCFDIDKGCSHDLWVQKVLPEG